jgi:hypothetical protein
MPKEHRRPFPARASPGRTTYSELRQGRLLGRFFWACRGKCQKARGHRGERSILARRTSKAICPHCDAMPPCRLRETPCVVEHPKPPQSKQARLSEGQLDEAQTGGREDKEEEEGGECQAKIMHGDGVYGEHEICPGASRRAISDRQTADRKRNGWEISEKPVFFAACFFDFVWKPTPTTTTTTASSSLVTRGGGRAGAFDRLGCNARRLA